MTLERRFWAKVVRAEPDDCWLWTGCTVHGYGQIGSGGAGAPMVLAHRLSWILANGAIPEGTGHLGMCVLHKCDVRRCVNPAHLFLGSHTDNMRDMARKGRKPSYPGERNPAAKLDVWTAVLVKTACQVGYTQERVAAAAGVSRRMVGMIAAGRRWSAAIAARRVP
jgi:hypothetical protein